jgi:prevent-host-death family protein
MNIASIADVKAKLSAYVKASTRSPVVITRNGKAVAALVPIADDDELERLMTSYSPKLRAILSKAEARIQAGHGIPHDEFWRQVEQRSKPKRKSA